jgi:hypothetical protein
LIKIFSLTNEQSQQRKQLTKSINENNQEYSIIKYLHLTKLDLFNVHDDYVEQFLHIEKTCLPKNIELKVAYKALQRVTHNFTRETTRINCAKISNLYSYDRFEISRQVRMYFPLIGLRSMLSYRWNKIGRKNTNIIQIRVLQIEKKGKE